MSDETGVAEFIRSHGGLREAVTPLATLATVSPSMLEDVIRLAMAMGIHAGERRAAEAQKFATVESAIKDATRAFWKGPGAW